MNVWMTARRGLIISLVYLQLIRNSRSCLLTKHRQIYAVSVPNIWKGIINTAYFKTYFQNIFPVCNQYQISPVSPSNWCCLHQPQISTPKRKSELCSWKWRFQFICAGKSSVSGAVGNRSNLKEDFSNNLSVKLCTECQPCRSEQRMKG